MKENRIFQERLYQTARMNGKSLQKMAEDIGVHENTLYRLKTQDDAWLSAPALIKVARTYGTDLNWLLGVYDGQDGESGAVCDADGC